MHIREPRDFEAVKSKRQARHRIKKFRKVVFVCLSIVMGFILVGYAAYLRPYPAVAAKTITPTTPVGQVALNWPAVGQAAIGAQGQGVMAETAAQKPVPIASVAKVMTALAVLKKHPLLIGQQGPSIPITAEEVARYNNYYSNDGSVVRVEVGQQLTEYQALQAMLLPSANNISDTLAIWAYGSMNDYLVASNQLAHSLGMTQTTLAGDASGFSPQTVSTAHDLVLLGEAAMKEPVIKEIVGQKSAVLPLVGTVYNVNVFLGRGGITGIKTGNTEEAGGCYLFAAERALADGQMVTSIGAIAGATSLGQAMTGSIPLLDSFYQGFSTSSVVAKGTVVGRYTPAWGGPSVDAITAQDTLLLNWRGSKAAIKVQLDSLKAPQASLAVAGNLTAQSSYGKTSVPVVLASPIAAPTWQWRIFRR